MPRGLTRHIPSRQQRALIREKDKYTLLAAETRLSILEWAVYDRLMAEAGNPKNTTDRAAILERARAYVRGQVRDAQEAHKTPEQHRQELWG